MDFVRGKFFHKPFTFFFMDFNNTYKDEEGTDVNVNFTEYINQYSTNFGTYRMIEAILEKDKGILAIFNKEDDNVHQNWYCMLHSFIQKKLIYKSVSDLEKLTSTN